MNVFIGSTTNQLLWNIELKSGNIAPHIYQLIYNTNSYNLFRDGAFITNIEFDDLYFEDENVRNERYTAIEAFRSGKSTAAEAAKQYVEKQQSALDKYYKE